MLKIKLGVFTKSNFFLLVLNNITLSTAFIALGKESLTDYFSVKERKRFRLNINEH